MRDEGLVLFSRWEEELPAPDELMPLNQTLITPDLALAFDIGSQSHSKSNETLSPQPPSSSADDYRNASLMSSQPAATAEFGTDSSEMGSGGAGDEPARTLKRPRLVWTPQLHKRFVDAVAHLGIKNAVPKTIMQLMSVDGLTRENVASHLQKYRLYLRRMQGLSNGGNGGGGGGNVTMAPDPATDHLFATSPIPRHFLNQGRPPTDQLLPFTTPQHHQNPQYGHTTVYQQAHGRHHRQMFSFELNPSGQIEHPYLARLPQQHNPLTGVAMQNTSPGYVEDFVSTTRDFERKVLTLFPTRDD